MVEIVTIDTVDYPAYSTLPEADEYMNAKFGEVGDAWRLADDDTKSRALATAYRDLSILPWIEGYATNADWLVAIVPASIEYAAALIEGSFFAQVSQSNSGIKRMAAGSANIEYFKSFTTYALSKILPSNVWAMLKPFLAGMDGLMGGSFASGTCGQSAFKYGYGFFLP